MAGHRREGFWLGISVKAGLGSRFRCVLNPGSGYIFQGHMISRKLELPRPWCVGKRTLRQHGLVEEGGHWGALVDMHVVGREWGPE